MMEEQPGNMCGGCGETCSSKRCIGCLHDFGTTESAWVKQPPLVTASAEQRAREVYGIDPGDNNRMTGADLDWLIRQLAAWPTRIDPERTTNQRYLMESAALTLTFAAEQSATREAAVEAATIERCAKVAETFPATVSITVQIPAYEDITSMGTPYIEPAHSVQRTRPSKPSDIAAAIRKGTDYAAIS